MVNGPALAIALAVALTLYVGGAVRHGVQRVGHKVKAGIGRVVHPHAKGSEDGHERSLSR